MLDVVVRQKNFLEDCVSYGRQVKRTDGHRNVRVVFSDDDKLILSKEGFGKFQRVRDIPLEVKASIRSKISVRKRHFQRCLSLQNFLKIVSLASFINLRSKSRH